MANGAIGLITGSHAQFLERAYVGPFRSLGVDNFPEVDPAAVERIILDWKDVNLPIG